MNGSEGWEYDHPLRIKASDEESIPCPNCKTELHRQDEHNLACPDCESGFSFMGDGDRGGRILVTEYAQPAAEVVFDA